jgi:hypothetical protein
MQAAEVLPLRDVQMGMEPSWWPPALGWWLVVAVLFGVLLPWLWRQSRRRKKRQQLMQYFDAVVQQAETPSMKVAAMSELLRRAARHIRPDADRLSGEAWLQFLDDGMQPAVFLQGAGALIQDGAFRPNVDAADVEALRVVARKRYAAWVGR